MGYLKEDGTIEPMSNEWVAKTQLEKQHRGGAQIASGYEMSEAEEFSDDYLQSLRESQHSAQTPPEDLDARAKSMWQAPDTGDLDSEIAWQETLRDGKIPYQGIVANPEKEKRMIPIAMNHVKDEVDRSWNGDFTNYYESQEAKYGAELLPEEMLPEFEKLVEYRKASDALEEHYATLKDSEAGSEQSMAREKKLRAAVESARKGMLDERVNYFETVDGLIEEKDAEIEEKRAYVNRMGGFPDAYFIQNQMRKEDAIAAKQSELDELIAERDQIASQKDFFFKMDQDPEQAISSEFGEMSQVPGDTAQEKLRNLFHIYLKTYEENRSDVELMDDDSFMEGMGKSFRNYFDNENTEDFTNLITNLKSIAPIVALNRGPITEDDGAWDVYGKTFAEAIFPGNKANLTKTQDVARNVEKALLTLQVSPEDITVNAADRIEKISSPYEAYSSKDWAQMGGTTTAIMLEMMATNVMLSPAMRASKLGKWLDEFGETGKIIAKNGDEYAKWLTKYKSGRGLVRSTFNGIEEGIKFEAAGELFPHAEDELNFYSGFFGAAIASPLNTVVDKKLKGYIMNQYASVFGSSANTALATTKEFGEYMMGKVGTMEAAAQGAKMLGRSTAEVFEEFGNELGNIYRDSDGWADIEGKFVDRFGDMSDNLHFAVSSFVMGSAFGAGNIVGDYASGKAKTSYEKLSEEEKVKFNEFITEYKLEMQETQEAFVESVKEQDEESSAVEEGSGESVETGTDGSAEEVGESGEAVSDEAIEQETESVEPEGVDTEAPAGSETSEVDDIPMAPYRDASDGDILHTQQEGNRVYNVKREGDEIVVSDMAGDQVKSGDARAKVFADYKEAYDYNDGKTLMEIEPEGDPNMTPAQYAEEVAAVSENSQEVVQTYRQHKESVEDSASGLEGTKDWAISQVIGAVDQKSYENWKGGEKSGKDFTNKGIAMNYFARKGDKAVPLDVIAQSANEALMGDYSGDQITVDDVANFIEANPRGREQFIREAMQDPTLDALAGRFKELTGMELTDDIVEQVAGQEVEEVATDDYSWLDSAKDKLDQGMALLDELEAKSDEYFGDKAMAGIVPPQLIIKVATKSMKAALQAGKSMVEVVDAGVKAIQNTEWYKKLSADDKKSAIENFKNSVSSASKAKQQEVKQESGKRQRRKFDKTMEENTTSKELNSMISKNRMFYDRVSNPQTLNEAIAYIDKQGGMGGAYEKTTKKSFVFNAKESSVVTAARMLLIDHYSQQLDAALNGDGANALELREKVNNLREVLARDATGMGRAIQVLAHWKLNTPLNVLYDLEKRVEEYNEQYQKKIEDPEVEKAVEEAAKELQKEVDKLKKQVLAGLKKNKELHKTVKSLIARGAKETPTTATGNTPGTPKRKVKRAPTTKEQRKKAKEDFNKALEKFRKGSQGTLNASIVPFSKEQIEAIVEMGVAVAKLGYIATVDIANAVIDQLAKDGITVPDGAVESVLEDNAELLSEQEKQMEAFAKENVDKMTAKINEIIAYHYTEKESVTKSLAEKLIDEAGLTGDEAAKLEEIVHKQMEKALREKGKDFMDKTMGKSPVFRKRKKKQIIDKMIEQVNAGAMDEQHYRQLFAIQFGLLPNITNEQAQRVKQLAENVQNQVEGTIFFNEAVKQMADYMTEIIPKKAWNTVFDVWVASMYANMLSGPTTSIVNLGSVESHKRMEVFGDLVNIFQHIETIKKTKRGSWKDMANDLMAFSAIPNFYYRHLGSVTAFMRGRGTAEFAQVWNAGGMSSKYIELLNKTNELGRNELERKKYKGMFSDKQRHRFKGGFINPFNYYKFSGRNLEAQDSYERATLEDRYLGEMVRRAYAEQGLRGSELREATIDTLLGKDIDMESIDKQVQEEANRFDELGTRELSSREKKIRRNELIREAIREKSGVSEDMESDILHTADVGVFTGDRNGAMAQAAAMIGAASNSNKIMKTLTFPFVPFTKVVGNVFEFMLDGFPVYGVARASGYSITGIASRIKTKEWSYKSLAENSAQVGAPGTLAHQKQMARAFLGTASLALAWAMFGIEDDDDPTDNFFMLTGQNKAGADFGGSNPKYPPYRIRIGDWEADYRMFPALFIPLSIIGNYNDQRLRLNRKEKASDEEYTELEKRMDLAVSTMTQSTGGMLGLSFTEGIQELMQMVGEIEVGEGEGEGEKLTTEDKVDFVTRKLMKTGAHLATGWMPQKANLLRQVEKIYDPSSYGQKDVESVLAYAVGIEKFVDSNVNVDILGNHITSLPGSKTMPFDDYFRDIHNDRAWQFLTKYGAVPDKPRNSVIRFNSEERRTMNQDEWYVFTRKSGEYFEQMVQQYLDRYSEDKIEARSNQFEAWYNTEYTGVQHDMLFFAQQARSMARKEVKNLVNQGKLEDERARLIDSALENYD